MKYFELRQACLDLLSTGVFPSIEAFPEAETSLVQAGLKRLALEFREWLTPHAMPELGLQAAERIWESALQQARREVEKRTELELVDARDHEQQWIDAEDKVDMLKKKLKRARAKNKLLREFLKENSKTK